MEPVRGLGLELSPPFSNFGLLRIRSALLGKREVPMTRKLFLLCFLSLMLAGLIAAPAPVSASNCPPNGCPLPGSSAASYCYAGCQNSPYFYYCYQACYNNLETAAGQYCRSCGVCCNY